MGQMTKVGKTATSTRQEDNQYTIIKYHETDVVRFNSNLIMLDCGGWRTATTKARMNQASNQYGLGYSVYQRKGIWYVEYQGETILFDKRTLVIKRNEADNEQ